MRLTEPLVAHCLELLSALGTPRSRRMFGGHGFYVDELFVALLAADTLFLKADDTVRPAFEAAGCRPFSYTAADGRRLLMAYWSAPDEAMESPALMLPWARLAMASALRAAAAKRPAAPRKTPAAARRNAATPASPGEAGAKPRKPSR